MQQKKCLAFPKFVSQHNPVSWLCRQLLGPHGLVLALICIISLETLYRQRCAFLYRIQLTEFTTGGLQSRWRNISMTIKRSGKHLSYISSVTAKCLNICVNVIFQFLLFNKLANLSKLLFLLCHCGVVSAD